MKIIADENIPYASEAFGRFGEVRLLPGRSITRAELSGADALIVRSVTPVGPPLLEGLAVRFVGTATIGVDHIDLDYLRRADIVFADAAGCNSVSVAEYVTAALLDLHARGYMSIAGDSLGIVGVGRIGSLVARMARSLGMTVVKYDPPRAARDPEFVSAALDELLGCRTLTFHVPLVRGGEHPTRRMVDDLFLERLGRGSVLLNASRGGVVDSASLSGALASGRLAAAVLDVWEEEPDVPAEPIGRCALATPHIAGYSFDGKLRGTEMMAAALGRFLGSGESWRAAEVLERKAGEIEIPSGRAVLDAVRTAVARAYDIRRDDADLRALIPMESGKRRSGFDALRRTYRARREFHAYEIRDADPGARALLAALGFSVTDA